MAEVISIIILGIVIIAQAIERYFFAKEMNNRVSEAVRAVLSRNINEFIAAREIDKPAKEIPPANDEIDLSEATDKQFNKALGIEE